VLIRDVFGILKNPRERERERERERGKENFKREKNYIQLACDFENYKSSFELI